MKPIVLKLAIKHRLNYLVNKMFKDKLTKKERQETELLSILEDIYET